MRQWGRREGAQWCGRGAGDESAARVHGLVTPEGKDPPDFMGGLRQSSSAQASAAAAAGTGGSSNLA